jgi:hypothetical protein
MHPNLAVATVLEVELDGGDGPRGFDTEDSLVEVLVSHRSSTTPALSAGFQPANPGPVPFGAALFPPSLQLYCTAPEAEGQGRRSR